MKFDLSISDFEFIKKRIPTAFKMIESFVTENNRVVFDVKDDKLSDFEDEFTFAVLDFGMDNEDTVNEIGKRIYFVYDKLLYQIE